MTDRAHEAADDAAAVATTLAAIEAKKARLAAEALAATVAEPIAATEAEKAAALIARGEPEAEGSGV